MEAYFKRVYGETKRDLWAYLRARTPSPQDAEDLLQETYLSFVRSLKSRGAEGIENPSALLTDIANKRLADFYKKRGKLSTVSLDASAGEDAAFGENLSSDLGVEPEVLAAEAVEEVRRRLSQKDETTRKIFDLYFLADQPLERVAELLGVKVSFVKNRLYRTLGELRETCIEGVRKK